jgi:formylglycine-generating enzyme required for sulfatase activity
MMKGKILVVVAVAAVLLAGGAAQANVFNMGGGLTSLETVTVGNPGNTGELSGSGAGGYGPSRICGAVAYTYNIGKYEVTAGQYTEFLNAVAATDTYALYNTYMWSDTYGCKIQRSGSSGSYTYSVTSDWANRPVNRVSWGDAARFANWLHNGQPTGAQNLSTTEDGAYYLNGATTNAQLLAVNREADWKWAITSEDEWYKAAYYNPATSSYYDYPTSSDGTPGNQLINPDPGNNANFFHQSSYTIGSPYWRTEVGEFENSGSPYGTFDQGGNVFEWNEAILYGYDLRGQRGGSAYDYYDFQQAAIRNVAGDPSSEDINCVGFRVSQVPEPATLSLLALGALAVIRGRRRYTEGPEGHFHSASTSARGSGGVSCKVRSDGAIPLIRTRVRPHGQLPMAPTGPFPLAKLTQRSREAEMVALSRFVFVTVACLGILALRTAEAQDYLYVCRQQSTTIGKYTTAGGVVNPSFITDLQHPSDIALDGNGNLFVVNNSGRNVGVYTTSGATVNTALISTSFYPWSIALDGEGYMYVSSGSSNLIAKYTTSGTTVNASLITTGLNHPLGIASDQAGHLFVANSYSGTIAEYTTSGQLVDAALISDLSYPVDLVCDGYGSIFVADQVRGVRQYTTAGVLVNDAAAPGFVGPCSIALDGRGNLFVGGPPATYTVPIGEFTTSGAVVNPALLTGFSSPHGLVVERVPEPATLSLLALGGLTVLRRRRTARGVLALAVGVGVVVAASMTAPAQAAGPIWQTYNGHQYALTENAGNWLEVQAEARAYAGNLVTINDAPENTWVLSTFAPDTVVWIGFYQPPGTPEPAEGWVWISGKPVTYTNWWRTQPNEYLSGDDYALMNSNAEDGVWFNGQWQDVPLQGWPGPHYGIIEVVPEPATLSLLVLGGLALIRRRRK